MAKHVPSSAMPGCTQDNSAAVSGHFAGPPAAERRQPDMRDGDDLAGGRAPVAPQEPQTTVPGSAASEAFRGSGTP